MVVARIRQHVANHNWFAVLIDLLIVIIGVFLGTQATNWNDGRMQGAAAANYRRAIVADLEANEADFVSRRAYYEAVRQHAIDALAVIESRAQSSGEQFLVDAYQASQVWSRPITRAAYDEMSGAAGLSTRIGDQELRAQLTAYYTQVRQFDVTALGVTSYRERLRRIMPYPVQSRIMQSCGDRVKTLKTGPQIAALPQRCVLRLRQAEITAASAKLFAGNLDEDLTRQIADLDQKISGFDRFRKLATALRLRLVSAEGPR